MTNIKKFNTSGHKPLFHFSFMWLCYFHTCVCSTCVPELWEAGMLNPCNRSSRRSWAPNYCTVPSDSMWSPWTMTLVYSETTFIFMWCHLAGLSGSDEDNQSWSLRRSCTCVNTRLAAKTVPRCWLERGRHCTLPRLLNSAPKTLDSSPRGRSCLPLGYWQCPLVSWSFRWVM